MSRTHSANAQHEQAVSAAAAAQALVQRASALQPKGTCWYCDRPVDNVKRFCSASCRHEYFEEEGLAGREEL